MLQARKDVSESASSIPCLGGTTFAHPGFFSVKKICRDFAASFTLGESKPKPAVQCRAGNQDVHAVSCLKQHNGLIADLEDYDGSFGSSELDTITGTITGLPGVDVPSDFNRSVKANRSNYNFQLGLLNTAEIAAWHDHLPS
jgi:hypothetical protein